MYFCGRENVKKLYMKHTQLIGEYRYTRTGVRCPISVLIYFLFVLSNLAPLAFFTHTHSQRGPNLFLSYDGHKLNIPKKAPFTIFDSAYTFFSYLCSRKQQPKKMEKNNNGYYTIQGTGAALSASFPYECVCCLHFSAPALFLSTKSAPL